MGVVNFFKHILGNNYPGSQAGIVGNSLNTAIQSFLGSDSNISEKEVMKIPAAQAAIELITGAVGQLPIKVYNRDTDGMPKELPNDYRNKLLNDEANDVLNGYAFKRKIAKDYLLYGTSKSKVKYLTPSSNHITGLYPLDAKDITVDVYTHDGVDRYGKVYLNNPSGSYEFDDDFLLSVLRDTNDGITGHGILDTNADIFNLALDQLDYENSLLKNGAMPSGVIETDDELTDRTLQEMYNGWNKQHQGGNNAGKTAVLAGGASYKPISNSPDKLQLANAKKNVVSDIARVFNIPESLINAGANKYKSNEQDSIYFVQNCLAPILSAIETALNKTLLTMQEKDDGYFFRFDRSSIVNSTLQDKVNAVASEFNNGLISLKEARKSLGYRNNTGEDDFLKLSQGNVLYDLDNHNLEILNKGQTATSSDISTIPAPSAGPNSNSESSDANEQAKSTSADGSSDSSS